MPPRARDRAKDKDQDNNERERRPVKKSGVGLMVPLLLGVLVFGAVAIVLLGGGPKKEAAPVETSTKPKPFANLPREEPPKKGARGGMGTTYVAEAPEGLAADANWIKACGIAAEGEKLWEEATAAKASGDVPKLNSVGKDARDKLNEAFDMTALWEEQLMEKYGDANPEVRKIIKVRSGWIDKVRWLHKSIAR